MIDVCYSFYAEHYGGSAAKMSETEFSQAVRRAAAFLSRASFGRCDSLELTDKLRFCVCDLCERMHEIRTRGDIVSENNDGYSVTYDNKADNDVPESEYMSIALQWLGAELFYRGG